MSASACEWCGVAIRRDPDGWWLAVKPTSDYASECDDSDDGLHGVGRVIDPDANEAAT